MNYLGINCGVEAGLGRVIIVVMDGQNQVMRHVFKSPSVFSFKENSAEILNWHRDNIISLVSQFDIQGIVVKKTERTSFHSIPKNRDIFKLYLEGVILSLAGSIGKFNKHYYKVNVEAILNKGEVFNLSIDEICEMFSLSNCFGEIKSVEAEATKDALLAVVSLSKILKK